jgi:hypothetical protein
LGSLCSDTESRTINFGPRSRGVTPDQPDYYRTIVHETGHYVFGLLDEYCNALGDCNGRGESLFWAAYRRLHRAEYPKNYGLMQNEHDPSASEMSAYSDYLSNFASIYCGPSPERATRQAFFRCAPCWETVAAKLRFYEPVWVFSPKGGNLIPGGSDDGWGRPDPPKRTGPDEPVGLPGGFYPPDPSSSVAPPEFEFLNVEADGRDVELARPISPRQLQRTDLFLRNGSNVRYVGTAQGAERTVVPGVRPGEELVLWTRDCLIEAHLAKAIIEEPSRSLDIHLRELPEPLTTASLVDSVTPGVCVTASLSATTPLAIDLRLRFDEKIPDVPEVSYSYGVSSGAVSMTNEGDRLFRGTLVVDTADTLFDGVGTFEIAASDTAGNENHFFATWEISWVSPDDPTDLAHRDALWQASPADVPAESNAITLAASTILHRSGAAELNAVGPMYSIGIAGVAEMNFGSGLNIEYVDEDVVGVDETSLRIYRWNDDLVQWVRDDSSYVSLAGNMVTTVTHVPGTYAVFAEATTTDSIPPSGVADLGATTGSMGGSVLLHWTAPGDDGDQGTAAEYLLRYASQPITETNWDSATGVVAPQVPSAGSMDEVFSIGVPQASSLYYFALKSRDEAGNTSQVSNTAYGVSGIDDPNFRPAAAQDVRAIDAPADGGEAVILTWTRSRDDGDGKETVRGYRIYRSEPAGSAPVLFDSTAAGSESYHDSSATSGQVYTYWVAAVDSVQQSMSEKNRAFSARNVGMPTGDFSSDAKVGLDDFSLFVDTYGIDSTDVEFDPLFDLDHNGDVYTGDNVILENHFGEGGTPVTNPEGQNGGAQIHYRFARGEGGLWHMDLSAAGVSNLAGYSFKVTYPSPALSVVGAAADSAGIVGNLLNREGGQTPLFLAGEPAAGTIRIANAIQRPSAMMAPEGVGFLARITLSGSSIAGVAVSDIVLMDSDRLLNYIAQASEVEDVASVLPPFLFQSYPNPFNGTTTIAFRVPQPTKVSLKLYDVQGRLIRTLVDGARPAGMHPIVWDGRSNTGHSVASGVYYYRLKTPGYEKSRKLVLVR